MLHGVRSAFNPRPILSDAAPIRPGAVPAYQLLVKCKQDGEWFGKVLSDTIRLVGRWLEDRYVSVIFPEEALAGRVPFPGLLPGLKCETVRLEGPDAWAFQAEQLDPAVPGRGWITDSKKIEPN